MTLQRCGASTSHNLRCGRFIGRAATTHFQGDGGLRSGAVVSDPHGVLGVAGSLVFGWMGQGRIDRDSNGPSEYLCETDGEGSQQHGMLTGVAGACVCSAQQRARG